MKRFFADWRNYTLVIASIIILVLLGVLISSDSVGGSADVVRVGERVITDQDVISKLKKTTGDDTVMKMISDALIESYAAKKGITVSDSEIDQFMQFETLRAEMSGKSLQESLQEQGTNLAEVKKEIRRLVIIVKLDLPEKDIESAVKQYTASRALPFTFPKRYRMRQFNYLTPADAEKAFDLLKKPEGVEQAAQLSVDSKGAAVVKLYMPRPGANDLLVKYLDGLKPGQASKPFSVSSQKEASDFRTIVQLVELLPEEPPTMENRGMMIGQNLIRENQDYMVKARSIESEAMAQVEVQFYTREYKQAYDRFNKEKSLNPQLRIPGLKPSGTSSNAPAVEMVPVPKGASPAPQSGK